MNILEKGYSICPTIWLDDPKLKKKGLLELLLRISSLTAEKGYCFASNQYFSEKLELTTVSVSQKIKELEALGYIEIAYQKRGAEVVKRFLRLKEILTDDLKEFKPTIKQNFKDNSISNNNISNNINFKQNFNRKNPDIKNLTTRNKQQYNNQDFTNSIDRYKSHYPTNKSGTLTVFTDSYDDLPFD